MQDDEVRIRDIEYQVREKDELIRTLRWKIAALRVSGSLAVVTTEAVAVASANRVLGLASMR